ncbi:hypothetical protein AMJ49_01275 [Parcubacteria bacterium DG_74_2]|nr:MAG: hypothetical protein AMJ49_01275 [Parcubacteria bacterium DG_74_2]
MLDFILIFLFLVVIVFSLVLGIIIIYHFKRFGIEADPNTKKLLNIFKFGMIILILLSFFFLLINFLIK